MSSRTLALAAVALWACAVVPAAAQNLEAGKSPTQIFASACAVCHNSPRGLLKTVSPGGLPGFLRQHYTTSTSMAGAMSAYVLANGAADRHAVEKPAPHRAAEPSRADGAAEPETRQKKPKLERRKPATESEASPSHESKPAAKPQAKPPVAAEPAKPDTSESETKPPAEVPPVVEKPAESGAAASESAPAPKEPEEPAEAAKPAPSSNMPVFELDKSRAKPDAASEKPAEPAPAPKSDTPASN